MTDVFLNFSGFVAHFRNMTLDPGFKCSCGKVYKLDNVWARIHRLHCHEHHNISLQESVSPLSYRSTPCIQMPDLSSCAADKSAETTPLLRHRHRPADAKWGH